MTQALKKLEQLAPAFGTTPLVKIDFKFQNKLKTIYAKYEAFNFSGSIKDRIAFAIIKKAYQKELLKEGQPIIEVTSGNTGIAFTALAKALGHDVKSLCPIG